MMYFTFSETKPAETLSSSECTEQHLRARLANPGPVPASSVSQSRKQGEMNGHCTARSSAPQGTVATSLASVHNSSNKQQDLSQSQQQQQQQQQLHKGHSDGCCSDLTTVSTAAVPRDASLNTSAGNVQQPHHEAQRKNNSSETVTSSTSGKNGSAARGKDVGGGGDGTSLQQQCGPQQQSLRNTHSSAPVNAQGNLNS